MDEAIFTVCFKSSEHAGKQILIDDLQNQINWHRDRINIAVLWHQSKIDEIEDKISELIDKP